MIGCARALPVRLGFVALLTACSCPASVYAQPEKIDRDLLTDGRPMLPLVWNAYRSPTLPAADLHGGPRLAKALASGSLKLSQREFLELVVENDLDLLSARYNSAIALVDVLRARSGQAARGVPGAPLPGSVFAGAIGAGVSTTAPLSSGGTGGAAISTQGRLVSFGARGVFDPTVNVNLSYDHLVNPLNTTRVAGVQAVTVPSTVLQTRIQQELPLGTSYSVSFNLQRQQSNQTGLLFNPALTSFGALQVYQPLLNGFGRASTQRFTTLARNNTRIVSESFRSLLNDTLARAANAYWDLVAVREARQVASEVVDVADRQYRDTLQRVDLGTMDRMDALAAQSQLAFARAQLVQAQTAVAQQEVLVTSMITRDGALGSGRLSLEPADTMPDPADVELPSIDRDISRALDQRAAIRQARLTVANYRVAQDYTRRNLLPALSVIGQVNVYALGKRTPDAVRQLLHYEYPEFSVGVSWSIPVFNRAAMADDMRAQLELQQGETALRRTETQVGMQVRTASLALAQAVAAGRASASAVVASQAAYHGEQARLSLGASTPFRVAQALRDLATAQSDDVRARVAIAKARVSYEAAVGTLLRENGIDAAAAEGELFRPDAANLPAHR